MTSLTKLKVVAPPQLSDAVRPELVRDGTADAHDTVSDAGQVRVGETLSKTIMLCEQLPELPHTSAARYVRVNTNLLAQVTFEVTSLTHVTVTVPEQLSLVVTSPTFGDGTCDAQLRYRVVGQAIKGFVTSRTLIV